MTTKPRNRYSMNVSLKKDTVELIDEIRAAFDPEISRNALVASWAKEATKRPLIWEPGRMPEPLWAAEVQARNAAREAATVANREQLPQPGGPDQEAPTRKIKEFSPEMDMDVDVPVADAGVRHIPGKIVGLDLRDPESPIVTVLICGPRLQSWRVGLSPDKLRRPPPPPWAGSQP